jgi:hypothetical protein
MEISMKKTIGLTTTLLLSFFLFSSFSFAGDLYFLENNKITYGSFYEDVRAKDARTGKSIHLIPMRKNDGAGNNIPVLHFDESNIYFGPMNKEAQITVILKGKQTTVKHYKGSGFRFVRLDKMR